MPGNVNRRASVHTSNEAGVSIDGPINLPESVWKPEGKKLGFRRRASMASVEVPISAPPKRRTSSTSINGDQAPTLMRRPATMSNGRSRSDPALVIPSRLPKLPSPPPSPGPDRRSGVKRELRIPSPKTAVSRIPSTSGALTRSSSPHVRTSSTPRENSNNAINQDLSGASSDEFEGSGWATQMSGKKRFSRLQTLARKDITPGVFRKEPELAPSLKPLPGVKALPRQLIVPDQIEGTTISNGDAESPGEDLSKHPEYEALSPKFDSIVRSIKKTCSHPSLLLSKILPDRDQLSGLEKTLAKLKADLNSEKFRDSYQKMLDRPKSARSSRILNLFPDYVKQQNEEIFAQRRLQKMRCEIRDTLQKSHSTMEISSALLLQHFKDVPNEALSSYIACFFDAYDINKNGKLETFEVQKALQDLGKPCSCQDVKDFFENAGASGNSIDRSHFEDMVRAMQGWEATPPTPPASKPESALSKPPKSSAGRQAPAVTKILPAHLNPMVIGPIKARDGVLQAFCN